MIDEHLRIQSLPLSVGQFVALGFGIPEHHRATAVPEHLRKCLAFIFLEREGTLVIASPQVGHWVLVVVPWQVLLVGWLIAQQAFAPDAGECSAKVGRERS
jgi:hypothetical protein